MDGQYIWGQLFNANQPIASDEKLLCDTGNTVFYRKTLSFSYYNNEYYSFLINKNNPSIRIQLYADSECLFNSGCGWGINNFNIKVNKATPGTNSTCLYKPFSSCPCADANVNCACYPGYFAFKQAFGDYICSACQPNCQDCASAIKCNSCIPGYSLLGNICVISPKGILDTQTNVLKIDLSRHYKNQQYVFQGYSANFWMKFGNKLTTIDKPLILLDPFLLSYKSSSPSFNLKYTNFNYLFSFSNYFSTILDYPVDPSQATNYETKWVPVSLSFSTNPAFEKKSFYIQLSINNEKSRVTFFDGAFPPTQILLFNYFSKITYRYLKVWDRFISTDLLNKANYV
jgi:hypothetical protein